MLNLRDKKILVTGGGGFAGSHVVENLIKIRHVPAENIFVPRSSQYDLRKREVCRQVMKGQDIVIHLAAKVGGIGLNREKPGEFFYDNIIMSTELMEAARLAGVEKFVGVGTICSYPKFTPVPFKETDLWIGYPEETNAPYGLAKKMMLIQSEAYRNQYKFNAINLLPVNLYGPRDNFNPASSHVIPALIRKISEAKKQNLDHIEIWGTGQATREFLYAADAAEGIVSAAERYNGIQPVNLGSGKEISIKDLVGLLCKLMDYRGEVRWNTAMPDGQPRRCLDVSRAREEFGFEARTSFEEGLRKTIEWYESQTA